MKRGSRPHDSAEERALYAAGYRRLPRLWVPADLCDRVIAEATQHGPDVRKIKRAAQEGDE